MSCGADGVLFYDVTTPALPVAVGVYPAPSALDVAIDGNTAFVAAADAGVFVLDITDPSRPSLASQIELPLAEPWFTGNGGPSLPPNWALGIGIHDGLLYVMSGYYDGVVSLPGFIFAYDYRTLNAPRLVTQYITGDWPWAVGFSGNQMFTAGGEGVFVQYDLTQPRNTIQLAQPPRELLNLYTGRYPTLTSSVKRQIRGGKFGPR